MIKIVLFIIAWLLISIIGGIIGGWLGPYTTGFRNYQQNAFQHEENDKKEGGKKIEK